MGKIYTSKIIAVAIFAFSSVAIAAPLATMDDYVWEFAKKNQSFNYYENNCEYDSLTSYRQCLEKSLDEHDNQLSKQWQLSERVVREKDSLYIKVPNRAMPLVFRDEQFSTNTESHSYFSLYDYDQSRQLLYLIRSFPEADTIIMIDLKTGFNQEFDGIDIGVSSGKKHIATVDRYSGTENITIWEKLSNGSYNTVYTTKIDDLKTHLDFYHGKGAQKYPEYIEIKWQQENSVLVDLFYKINDADDIVYRVRFNVIKKHHSTWQVVAVK